MKGTFMKGTFEKNSNANSKRTLKRVLRMLAFAMVIVLTLNCYSDGLRSRAAGTGDGNALLNQVVLKNSSTNAVISSGDKITADDSIVVEYHLKDLYPIGTNKNIEQGTTYSFKVPKELKVLTQTGWTVYAGNVTLAHCTYDSASHTIQVTFDDGCFDANGFAIDGVHGTFIGFTASLNSSELGSGDNQSLKFKIESGEYTFSFNYGEDAGITKSGSYDDASKLITWTITIDEGSKTYDKVLLQDTFSSNQVFVTNSLKEKVDDGAFTACNSVNVSGNTISYEYTPGNTTRTFTYQTKFTEAALNPGYVPNNTIELTATNNASIVDPDENNKKIAETGEVTLRANVTVETQYPTTVILDKVGKWHVREDNGLLWHVAVNPAKENYGNDVYLIETIGGSPSQVQTGDIKQKLGDNPIRNVKVNNVDATAEQLAKITIAPAGTGFASNEYKISFGDLLNGNTVEFDFFTVMSEDEIEFYQGNNNTEALGRTGRNTVTMYQTTTQLKSVDAIVRAYPKVLDKSFEDYDYSTRELEWKIDVNYDFMKLEDVVLEDTIMAGAFADKVIVKTYKNGDVTHVAETTQLSTTPNQAGMFYSYNEQSKMLTINIGDIPRNTKYDVMVYTVLDEDDEINDNGTIKTLANYNGTIEVGNKVTMKKTGSSPVTVEATGTIDNKILEKSGKVTGAGVASYEIKLNQPQTGWPQQSEVIDIMSPGMALDVASIKLYEASVAADGTMTATNEVDKSLYERKHSILEDGNADGEQAGSTKLVVILPENAGNKAYILKYDAVLEEDTTYDKFTNKVKLQGVTSQETNTDTEISEQELRGYGGATLITYSKVKLIKQNESQEALKGAEFVLLLNGEEVARQTTDANGEIIFSYLTPGETYTIKEVKAPEGYVIDENSTWEFVAKDKGDRYYLQNPHVFINKLEEKTPDDDDNKTTEDETTESGTPGNEGVEDEDRTSEDESTETGTPGDGEDDDDKTSEDKSTETGTPGDDDDDKTSEDNTTEPGTSGGDENDKTSEEESTETPGDEDDEDDKTSDDASTSTEASKDNESSKSDSDSKTDNKQNNKDNVPKTGDANIYKIMLVALLSIACMAIVACKRKKAL